MHHNAAGYSGTDGNAVWLHHNDLYDNAQRVHHRRLHRVRAPRLPAGLGPAREERVLLEQLQPLHRRLGHRPDRPDAGRHRRCGSPAATTTSSATTGSRTTGAAARCCSRSPTPFVCATTRRTAIAGLHARADQHLLPQPFYGNTMGVTPEGQAPARTASTSGGTSGPGTANNCWFDNTGTDGTAASVKTAPHDACPRTAPPASGPAASHGQAAELLVCSACPRATLLSVVRHAAEAERLAAALRRIAVALAVAGCGGDSAPADQGVGGNTPLRLANCDDWNALGPRRAPGHDRQLGTQRRVERRSPRRGPRRGPGLRRARGHCEPSSRRLQALQALRARRGLLRPLARPPPLTPLNSAALTALHGKLRHGTVAFDSVARMTELGSSRAAGDPLAGTQRSTGAVERVPTSSAVGRIAAVLALVGAAIVVLLLLLGGGGSYTVTAKFENASQLVKGNTVNVAGVSAGSVKEHQARRRRPGAGRARGLRRVRAAAARAPTPPSAPSRSRGSPTATSTSTCRRRRAEDETIESGGTIEQVDTTSEVDLDQLFNTLDEHTVAGLKSVIKGFARSYDGVGPRPTGASTTSTPSSPPHAECSASSTATSARSSR